MWGLLTLTPTTRNINFCGQYNKIILCLQNLKLRKADCPYLFCACLCALLTSCYLLAYHDFWVPKNKFCTANFLCFTKCYPTNVSTYMVLQNYPQSTPLQKCQCLLKTSWHGFASYSGLYLLPLCCLFNSFNDPTICDKPNAVYHSCALKELIPSATVEIRPSHCPVFDCLQY